LKELLEITKQQREDDVIRDRAIKNIKNIYDNKIERLACEISIIESEMRDIDYEKFMNDHNAVCSNNHKSHISSTECFRCGKKLHGSMHHIVPKYFGGNDLNINLVFLCDKCHDEVEICTYELFNKKMIYDTNVLRSYIIGGFPGEPGFE
jgi:5-methylcytosine-specific restriction endonuclease McrA